MEWYTSEEADRLIAYYSATLIGQSFTGYEIVIDSVVKEMGSADQFSIKVVASKDDIKLWKDITCVASYFEIPLPHAVLKQSG